MSITTFLNNVNYYIINPIILLLFSVASAYFIYGVIKFLSAGADDKGSGRAEAKNAIMWGIVGMFIMFSVYGIIGAVMSTFGIDNLPDDAKGYLVPNATQQQ